MERFIKQFLKSFCWAILLDWIVNNWHTFRVIAQMRAIYSLFLMVMSTIMLLCYFIWMVRASEATVSKFTTFINRLRNFICLLYFHSLAKNWKNLIRKWSSVEQYLPLLNTDSEKNVLRRRITMLQIIVISVSTSKLDPLSDV